MTRKIAKQSILSRNKLLPPNICFLNLVTDAKACSKEVRIRSMYPYTFAVFRPESDNTDLPKALTRDNEIYLWELSALVGERREGVEASGRGLCVAGHWTLAMRGRGRSHGESSASRGFVLGTKGRAPYIFIVNSWSDFIEPLLVLCHVWGTNLNTSK